MEYINGFKNRAQSYCDAVNLYEESIANEYRIAAAVLMSNNSPENVPFKVINMCSTIDKIKKYLPIGVEYIPYEINKEFVDCAKQLTTESINDVDEYNIKYCQSLSSIPESNSSVDRILCLTALHHFNDDERYLFYREVKRIIKPRTGMFVVGDVKKDSSQQSFLDNIVNKYNSKGHIATFFDDNDKLLMQKAGFNVKVCDVKYTWDFESMNDCITFMKLLFGLDLATDKQIKDGILKHLNVSNDKDNKVRVDWELIYFICT